MSTNTGALQIEFEGPSLSSKRSFRLEFGDRIVVGRGQKCDLSVDEDTLSREHVECIWNGTRLKFQDLNSTNGLFVLSNGEKKRTSSVEGIGENGSLELYFGNMKLLVSWKALSAVLHLDKTEIAASEESPERFNSDRRDTHEKSPSEKHQQAASSSDSANPLKEREKESEFGDFSEEEFAGQQKSVLLERPDRTLNYKPFLIVLGVLIFFLGGALFYWQEQLGSLWSLPDSLLQQGAEWDVIYLWWKNLGRHILLAVLSAGFTLWLLYRLAVFNKKIILCALVPVLFVLFLFFPFLKSPRTFSWQHMLKFKHLMRAAPEESLLQERKNFFQKEAKQFTGSSYFYKEYLFSHVQLIFDACKSKRVALSWEKKKLCLIMLQSVSIESFEEIQPVLFEKIIPDMVYVLSLDALLRIVSAEGVQSMGVKLLVKNLERIGFSQKSQSWLERFESAEDDFESSIDQLLEERRKYENRFDQSISKFDLDSDFMFSIPNPLDAGI